MLGVLGALEVTGARGAVPVGGPVPRRVLCALASHAGSVVSIDALIDAAWGDQPPASAERTLASHLTRLREALASLDGGGVAIERVGGGMRLVCPPDDLDSALFEKLLERSRDVAAPDAVSALRQALGLWRDPVPFAELVDTPAYPVAQAARLTELHATATERLVAALLDAGDAAGASVEAEARLAADPYRERLWELLVRALYRQDRQADALAACRRARAELAEGLGIDPGPALRELEARVLAQDESLASSAPLRRPCPYKGLSRYDDSDAPLFVGRERLVDELVGRLVDGRLLVVVGPSGAGKSSLVRAGLVPALREGAVPGSDGWTVVVVVPGADPVGALREVAADVVVVDQAEEALLVADEGAVSAFCDLVLDLVQGGTRVVLSLRADFYGALTQHSGLARRAGPATALVLAPSDAELRRIIVEPAARVGLHVDGDLVDAVVADVRDQPGVLPVLSTALVRTWEHRDGDRLTLAGYLAGGGVRAALERVGEEAWAGLDSDVERAACRRLLLRLAAFEDGRWVRRRASRAEVAPVGDTHAATALMALTEARLVTIRADDVEVTHESLLTGWPRLHGWLQDAQAHVGVLERLASATAGWVAAGRDEAELYRGTRLQAALDTAAARPQDLTDSEHEFLAASREYADREVEQERARTRREAEGRRRTRMVAFGLAGALVLAGIAGGVAVSRQRAADANAAAAELAARAADADRLGSLALTGGAEYDRSLLYAAQGFALDPSPKSASNLFAALERGDAVQSVRTTPGLEQSLVLTSDGEHLVGVTDDGWLTSWPVDGGAGQATHRLDGVSYAGRPMAAVAGGRVAVQTADGAVVADPETGQRGAAAPMWLLGAPAPASSATGITDDGALMTMPVTAGPVARMPRPLDFNDAVACGAHLCVTYGRTGHVARVDARGHLVGTAVALPPDCDETRPVASTDGTRLALACDAGLIKVVDPEDGRVVRVLAGGATEWRPLAFSPDGTLLATRDFDRVFLWDLTDPYKAPDKLLGHSGRVTAGVFSADGSALFTAAEDRTIITWSVDPTKRLGAMVTDRLAGATVTLWVSGSDALVGSNCTDSPACGIQSVDLTTGQVRGFAGGNPHTGHSFLTVRTGRDTGLIVSVDDAGVTAVWDLGRHRLLGTVALPALDSDHYGPDTWLSADGRFAATLRDGDSGPIVVDVATRSVVRRLPVLPPSRSAAQRSTVQGWSPDGRALYVTRVLTSGSELLVVDALTGAVRWQSSLPGDVPNEVTSDPSGRFLVVALNDGKVLFLDAGDGHLLAPPAVSATGQVFNVSVSRDGRWVASTGSTAAVTLWDTRTFRPVGAPLAFDLDGTARARFASDGRVVVANNTTVRTVVVDPVAWSVRACAEAGRTLTRDEWETVLPNRTYAPACAAGG